MRFNPFGYGVDARLPSLWPYPADCCRSAVHLTLFSCLVLITELGWKQSLLSFVLLLAIQDDISIWNCRCCTPVHALLGYCVLAVCSVIVCTHLPPLCRYVKESGSLTKALASNAIFVVFCNIYDASPLSADFAPAKACADSDISRGGSNAGWVSDFNARVQLPSDWRATFVRGQIALQSSPDGKPDRGFPPDDNRGSKIIYVYICMFFVIVFAKCLPLFSA